MSGTSTIDLTGLNRAEVLAALYNAAKPQGAGFIAYDPTPMTTGEAESLLAQTDYFDYVHGRVMKVYLGDDSLNPWGYDRDNGDGAAARAIDSLRGTGDTNSVLIRTQHASATQVAADDALSRLDEETTAAEEGGVATFNLGLGDLADYIRPRAEGALRNTRSPLD